MRGAGGICYNGLMENQVDSYQEERPWGNFRRFTNNTPSTVKIITVKPNEELSLQSHAKRAEFWRVISGSGMWEVDEMKQNFSIGDEKFVPQGSKHRLIAGRNGIEILEIALGDFNEEDIVRYEDKYGRA
jgi:mannose-6-phosphate isomerase-like protein (cupin superfamily)